MAIAGSHASHGWSPYCGPAPTPDELFARWNLDPALLVALATAAFLLWRATSSDAQRRYLAAALALVLLLFVSPLCALSSALFSARATHHVLLTAVVAPLIVLVLPNRLSGLPGSVAFWTGASAVTFWLWHAPVLYAAALSSNVLYWAMQLSLIATAMGFWAALRRSTTPAAIAALLAATVQMGLLGALLTFAATPIYTPHILTTAAWGLSALEDQQLAGLIMWVPAAGLYLGAAVAIAHRWLAHEERGFPA